MRHPAAAIVAPSSLFLGLVTWVSAHSNEAGEVDPAAPRLIAVLNERVQERFKDVDNGFGISRIISPRHTTHRFEPESVSERSAVSEIHKAGFEVILYVGRHGRGAKGPVAVTTAPLGSRTEVSTAPHPDELRGVVDRGLQAFASADSYTFGLPGWKFIAYPVRASSAKCLACHSNLKLGEPVGAVIYGYRPTVDAR